jgi:hypothetical protein
MFVGEKDIINRPGVFRDHFGRVYVTAYQKHITKTGLYVGDEVFATSLETRNDDCRGCYFDQS